MTIDTAVALIVLSGVILTGVLGLIGVIVGNHYADKRERRKQAAIEESRHRENSGALAATHSKLAEMAATIAHLQSQLPEDGIDVWIRAVQTNTTAIERHGEAMSRLADSMDALDQRVTNQEKAILALQAGKS